MSGWIQPNQKDAGKGKQEAESQFQRALTSCRLCRWREGPPAKEGGLSKKVGKGRTRSLPRRIQKGRCAADVSALASETHVRLLTSRRVG